MSTGSFNRRNTVLSMLLLGFGTAVYAEETCVSMNMSIPDNSSDGISIQIDLAGGAGEVIESIEVGVELAHPWVGDLVITLASPDGTSVTLLDRPGIPSTGFPGPFGCGGRDVDAVFSDGALVSAEGLCSYAAQPTITGLVLPNQALDSFFGSSAAGTWVVTISDRSLYDTGLLTRICLTTVTTQSCAPDLTGDGNLDFFDVSAFLSAYSAGDILADFTGDGQLNFFDVSAFLGAYALGCP